MKFLFPLSEWPKQPETQRRAWQNSMTRALINQTVTFCMQRILTTPSFEDTFPLYRKKKQYKKSHCSLVPTLLHFCSHARISPATTDRKYWAVLSMLFWNVILAFLTHTLWCLISMNIYEYLFVNKLVPTDHCSVHKLLGQRTETRTEWPKFLHYQAVPFNMVSSLPSRKGMKIVWFRHMSNLHCNSRNEPTHPGRLLVDKDRIKRLPFQCWSCIKINASVIKNINPSKILQIYSFHCLFPVFDLHWTRYFSHAAGAGRLQVEDLVNTLLPDLFTWQHMNYSSYPARITASNKQTSLLASEQVWQNCLCDSNTEALLWTLTFT